MSGAWPGCTFFIRAWIQFLRIPDVMADNVYTPFGVCEIKNIHAENHLFFGGGVLVSA